MNSQNHFALGASQSWMYEYQLGITSDGRKGYKDFVVQPVAGGNSTSVEGSFTSSYGLIESGWQAENGTISSYEATVPANTTATLYLPVEKTVSELDHVPGVSFEGMATRNGQLTAKFELGAGAYDFAIDVDDVTATADGEFVRSVDEQGGQLAGLIAGYRAEGQINAHVIAGMLDRLERALARARAGNQVAAIGYLQHLIDRANNQIKGDAADLAARDVIVAATRDLMERLAAAGFRVPSAAGRDPAVAPPTRRSG
ncbi:alpha-L-rhamnosidase C-terminal domain-containing protein [Motilibacter aurantiacus]|uniref:alpha-L-rhamnosidase C-terminal domain-containing protein n=1 Tax=Motilibacter aurantiacus TaxID=2714955 RepID=UPI00140A9D9A|nr:alpha-L-rhamnosidase C-terminal domain-containing protein [Motilibacter aurantiacus]NHC45313.1 hypothetical protein [Motilibacter aurantiacus]